MSTHFSLADWLRIERAVWTVDTYLTTLPGRRRRALRRDLRANLRASAEQVGGGQAVRGLGSLRGLSLDYLGAEFGEGRPRPSMLKGVAWTVAVEALVIVVAVVGFNAFTSGLEAGAAAPGTYTWDGWRLLGLQGEVTVLGSGELGQVSGSVSLLPVLVPLAIAFVVGSRLWRVIPLMRRSPRVPRTRRSELG